MIVGTLIYESLLLEGRAGNLTNLTLEMVLAEKPPTWLPVMYERLKHLIINVDTFREKMRISHYPQVGGKEKKSGKRVEKQPKGIKVVKMKDNVVGKATNIGEHQEAT